MTSRATTVTAMLLALMFGPSFVNFASAVQKTAEQLQAEFDREPNPKKRLKLALDFTDRQLKDLLSAYSSEDGMQGTQQLEIYLAGIERFEKAVDDNGKDIGKNVEIRLRKQLVTLESFAMSASYTERPAIEDAAKRVSAFHERVLHHIMRPRK
jgi:hypothetical protein